MMVQGDFFFGDCPECTVGIKRVSDDLGYAHVVNPWEFGCTLIMCLAVRYRAELWPTPPRPRYRWRWCLMQSVPNDLDLHLERAA